MADSAQFGTQLTKQSGTNIISFYSFTTSATFSFRAFLTDYNDQYNVNFSPQEIYGRMDPIYTYKNTIRRISLAFDVPSYDLSEAKNNLLRSDQLIKSLYPTYTDTEGQGTAIINSPPLFRIKFGNLIYNVLKQVDSNDPYTNGLLGFIDGYAFKPDIDSGFFVEDDKHMIYPKNFKVSFNFNIIHEHLLGNRFNGVLNVPRITVGNKIKNNYSHNYDSTDSEVLPPVTNQEASSTATPTNNTQQYIYNNRGSGFRLLDSAKNTFTGPVIYRGITAAEGFTKRKK